MKCLRSVLVGFVVIACFFLSGFKRHIPLHESSGKSQQSADRIKQQKILDLTVPFREASFQEKPENYTIVQRGSTDALAANNKSNIKAVELQGKVIMSQEPEVGKIKSADGAGIVINLHH